MNETFIKEGFTKGKVMKEMFSIKCLRKIFLKVSFAKECYNKNTIHLNVHSSVGGDGYSTSNK